MRNLFTFFLLLSVNSTVQAQTAVLTEADLMKACMREIHILQMADDSATVLEMMVYSESKFPEGTRGCCGQEKWKVETPAVIDPRLEQIVGLSKSNLPMAVQSISGDGLWLNQVSLEILMAPEMTVNPTTKNKRVETLVRLTIPHTGTNAGVLKIISDDVQTASNRLETFDSSGRNLTHVDLLEKPEQFSCTRQIVRAGF